MSLRGKTLIIVGITIVSLIAIPYFMLQNILQRSIEGIEKTAMRQDVEGILGTLDRDLAALDMFNRDWAAWDDTCAFIEDRNEAYVKSNLGPDVFADAKVNVILYYDVQGLLVFKRAVDWRRRNEVGFPERLEKYLGENSAVIKHAGVDDCQKGLVLLPEGPLFLVSRPIVTSSGKGPIRGTLVMGRYLDEESIREATKRTGYVISMFRLHDQQMPEDFRAAESFLTGGRDIYVHPLNDQYVAGYVLMRDIQGAPILILRVDAPREIHKQGQASIYDFILYFLPTSILFGLATLFLLEKLVTSRLMSLTRSVSVIGASGDLSVRVRAGGKDELSILAREVNKMLGSLERSSAALRAQKEFSESILNSAINIVLTCDRDGTITFINKYALELMGYEKHEVIGKNWFATFLPERIRQQKLQALRAFFGSDLRFRLIENPVLCRNGEERLILWNSTCLRDEKGNAVGLVSIGNDITERKAAEEALARETAKLSAIISSMEEGVVFVDRNDTIVEVNPFFSRLFGEPREALLGKTIWELNGGVIVSELSSYVNLFKSSRGHAPITLERQFGSFQVVFRIQPIYNESGYDSVLINVIDVTALVASRREAQSAYLELEKKVQELQQSRLVMLNMMQDMGEANRVLKETQDQLIQQEKMSSIGTLAAGVAHEFNNILAGMMGFASLAQADPARSARLAEIILREGDHAAKVIRSLLSFSKHGEQSLAPVDLKLVVEDVLSLTHREFDKNDIAVETEYAPVPLLMVDVSQIEQVLLNMFINACHALEGGGKLKVSLKTVDKEILIAIEDTGCGVPPEHLPKIFDPFFSTKGVWGKDKQAGVGLGLSVSRNIIAAHHGRIEVQSTVGKGTTFTIHLPVPEKTVEEKLRAVTGVLKRDAGKSYRVLVADDDEVLRELLMEILRKMGHEATIVSSGEEVLEELRKSSYDYLFLDMMMPGKYDGKYVLQKIKELKLDTKIFICTGRVQDENLAELLKKADGYVRKPFTMNEIGAAINGEFIPDEAPTGHAE